MRVAAASALLMFVVACGGQAPDGGRDGDGGGAGTGTGGFATLTAGGETWTFSDVYCEADDPERYDFFLQGVEDPVNVLVTVERGPGDGETHFMLLYNHVESESVLGRGFATPVEFLRVDGSTVTAEVELVDYRPEANNAPVMVTFEGVCP